MVKWKRNYELKGNLKRILPIGFVLFLFLQLYQPARNSDGGQVLPIHITQLYDVPVDVQDILQISCYDCHSNNTNYPWYSYLQPTRTFMEWDINKGKKNLNFSEFGNYSKRKQENKLASIAKQIEKGEMPLPIYTLIHRDAILTNAQKETISRWISMIANKPK